jgi:hypothetical protein
MNVQERRGVVLLEVIVAVTILVIAGLSATLWVRQISDSLARTQTAANDVRTASRYLDIIALWPREDLDRHLGERRQGPWMVRIDRPTPTVYGVAINDSLGTHVLLKTWLYRREVTGAGS